MDQPLAGTTPLTGVTAIAAGGDINMNDSHTCALLTNHTVKCWGYGGDGELGYGGTDFSMPTPQAVSGISTANAIGAYAFSSCAVLSNGTVKCWGDDSVGELGDGAPAASAASPVQVSTLSTAVSLSTGSTSSTTCAVLMTGAASCWGENHYGQLGNGSTSSLSNSATPVAVSSLTNVTQLSVGYTTACAVLATGGVDCWGWGSSDLIPNSSASTTFQSTALPVQW